MPSQSSQLPLLGGSFASAAAGQASSRDIRAGPRADLRGAVEWSRRENRVPNGTLTLRRTSTTPHGTTMSQVSNADSIARIDSSSGSQSQQPFTQIPESDAPLRYSKESMYDIWQHLQQSDALNPASLDRIRDVGIDNSTVTANGYSGRWGKTSDSTRDYNLAADVCWNQAGHNEILNMEEPRGSEATMFSTDVNAPAKQPPQNASGKDHNNIMTANGRRLSISNIQGGVGSFGLASPSSVRPGPRRRETGDVPPGSVVSPAVGSRYGRDEPSSFFPRRGAERDNTPDDRSDDTPNKSSSPFGLLRSNTGGSILGNGNSSPWSAASPSSGVPPMGAFGNFALGSNTGSPATTSEKRVGMGTLRGESRFAQLMPRESVDDLARQSEVPNRLQERSWRSQQQADNDPFADEHIQPGSSAPTGSREGSLDAGAKPDQDIGERFVEDTSSGRQEDSRKSSESQRGFGRIDETTANSDITQARSHGHGDLNERNIFGSGIARAFTNPILDAGDRSATSSVNGTRGFPSLSGGLGSLTGLSSFGGWPTSAQTASTPDRERNGFQSAFGNSLFSTSGDLPSPSLGGLSGGNVFGSGGTLGRGSKLGNLFPPAMQAQMHSADNDQPIDNPEQRQSGGFGAIGRNNTFTRDVDSPLRNGRGVFDDMLSTSQNRAAETQPSFNQHREVSASFAQNPVVVAPTYHSAQESSDSVVNPSQPQQRQMVMPDRMRWVYLDPQGQVQGPWSGLEMHEWYKASFFTADLSVRKLEESEFEPLGQMIRRIGNSREPFLVPSMGVPHGEPTRTEGAPFTATNAATTQAGTVQPPFAGAFPSFGTTLTAEQQNNLERRKQEEQYLMARQREQLAQEQTQRKQREVALQMQMQNVPTPLHHHSSSHNLQSQPSFGNMMSPVGMPSQGHLPASASFYDTVRQGPPTAGLSNVQDYFRQDDISRLDLQDRQPAFGVPIPQNQGQQLPSVFALQPDMQRDARVDQARPQTEAYHREFERFRAQRDLEEQEFIQEHMTAPSSAAPIGPPQRKQQEASFQEPVPVEREAAYRTGSETREVAPQPLSLTEQVQKAASAKQSPAVQAESPWSKVDSGIPMPFPPPRETTTPLPAPTAQRGRSDLAETLNMGTRSASESSDNNIMTPSVASWAPVEAPKGLSLREIQEAEAKAAAKREKTAMAQRRAAAELEARNQPVTALPAPGLPISSTWATSGTPTPSAATGTTSPWAKANTAKASAPLASTAASKKPLADILREEEIRKAKLAQAIAPQLGQVAGGKRYADLASKPNVQPTQPGGGVWSTVGASGKAKAIPAAPAASSTLLSGRSFSAASVAPILTQKLAKPVTVAPRNITSTLASSNVSAANTEFTKWIQLSLDGKMNDGIVVKDFGAMLLELPAEQQLIADSVYANSKTVDGRRFADEYVRRKKLADKGIVEAAGVGLSGAAGSSGGGGWSDVAKKNPVKEEAGPPAGFKVVPNKKKGRK